MLTSHTFVHIRLPSSLDLFPALKLFFLFYFSIMNVLSFDFMPSSVDEEVFCPVTSFYSFRNDCRIYNVYSLYLSTDSFFDSRERALLLTHPEFCV